MTDNASKIHTLDDLVHYGNRLHYNTALEVIINGVAGFIVLKHSTKAMGIYKYYILSTILWAFMMDFNLTFIFGPYFILPTAIICSAGAVGRNFDWIWGRVVPYCFLHFNLSFCGLSIIYGFMYQYFSLIGEPEFFHSAKGIIILFLIMIIYPLPSIISLLTTIDREGGITFVRDNYPFAYDLYVTAPCNTFVINFKSTIYFASVFVQIVLVCVVAWVMTIKIHRKLYQLKGSLSSTTLKARRQLVGALILQMLVPASLLVTPALIILGAITLKVDNMKPFSLYAMSIWALHSCINALTVILVITPYRKALIGYITWPFRKSRPISISNDTLFTTSSAVP